MENAESYKLGETTAIRHASGTYFDSRTPELVKEILETLRNSGERVRLFVGNAETGEVWPEEWHVTGRIGRSMGPCRVPLLISSRRAIGGCPVLDHCLVGILSKRGWIYRHPKLDFGSWEIAAPTHPDYAADVNHNGIVHSRHKSREQAERYIAFMTGKRLAK